MTPAQTPEPVLLETITSEFLSALERSGRDWHRVRSAILGLEHRIIREAHGEPWSPELRLYLTDRILRALAIARCEAIEREEFEWAHEIGLRLQELELTGAGPA